MKNKNFIIAGVCIVAVVFAGVSHYSTNTGGDSEEGAFVAETQMTTWRCTCKYPSPDDKSGYKKEFVCGISLEKCVKEMCVMDVAYCSGTVGGSIVVGEDKNIMDRNADYMVQKRSTQ